jgi:hypothetical protein
MAPKKVTNFENPKRKIIMTTVEQKKNLSLSGKKIHVYRTWPFSTFFMEYVSPSKQQYLSTTLLFLFWLDNVCMILRI